jgi:hypothetical protein
MLTEFPLLLLLQHALLPHLQHGLLHLLLELLNLVLAHSPDVLVRVLEVILGFVQDVG